MYGNQGCFCQLMLYILLHLEGWWCHNKIVTPPPHKHLLSQLKTVEAVCLMGTDVRLHEPPNPSSLHISFTRSSAVQPRLA